jgi:2,3-bisphosphoglycerate-dependent phosphoglycerate mutase
MPDQETRVAVRIVFETHSTSEDNERGIATGWLPGALSDIGREQAAELGRRRAADGIAAVFSSDLARAVETATIAARATGARILLDWRLRECDYGALNGSPAAELRAGRAEFFDQPYPGGESWRQAVARVAGFVADLPSRWAGQRVLIIGHVATHWGLQNLLLGTSLEELASCDSDWQPGWEYTLE